MQLYIIEIICCDTLPRPRHCRWHSFVALGLLTISTLHASMSQYQLPYLSQHHMHPYHNTNFHITLNTTCIHVTIPTCLPLQHHLHTRLLPAKEWALSERCKSQRESLVRAQIQPKNEAKKYKMCLPFAGLYTLSIIGLAYWIQNL